MAAIEEASNSSSNTPYLEVIELFSCYFLIGLSISSQLDEKLSFSYLLQMVLAAITAHGEEGSSKTAITEYIEATYANTLREGYTAAISETLTMLQESGELLFVNNLYKVPGSRIRGRGRPKKVKPTLPPGALPPTPRPRGRPSKQKDSQSNAVKVVGGVPRRRGRPLKTKDSNAAAVKKAGGIPRRRGRPPNKHRPLAPAASKAVSKGDETAPSASGVKRGRGRPPKVKSAVADVAAD